MADTPRVHRFPSTGDAYDSSQSMCFCDDGDDGHEVEDGDVLVVASEGAVAVLVEAWPTSIDGKARAGADFHVALPEWDWTRVPLTSTDAVRDYSPSLAVAREQAEMLP